MFLFAKNCVRMAVILTAASLCFAALAGRALGQELNAEAKSKEAVEARAKRNAQIFQNNASILTFLDRYGKRTGQIGERALYENAVLSPDGKRIAAIKDDLENESADLWVFDVTTGAVARFTTSIRTEFVDTPSWSALPPSVLPKAADWPTWRCERAKKGSTCAPPTAKEQRNSCTRIPAPSWT